MVIYYMRNKKIYKKFRCKKIKQNVKLPTTGLIPDPTIGKNYPIDIISTEKYLENRSICLIEEQLRISELYCI